jgi:NitT/TauT family transport system substrate-binding protein
LGVRGQGRIKELAMVLRFSRREVIGGIAAGASSSFTPARIARAQEETSQIRFVRQIGLGYLQIYLIEAQNLLDKHVRALGHPGVTATFQPVASPATMNDMLLGGQADIVVAGFPPFLVLWDKTFGRADVRSIAALCCQPNYINTNNPNVASVGDFTEKDRIALPAIGVSTQATYLQMIAATLYGVDEYKHFDHLTVGLPHAEAAAALISGKTEITAHFASPPLMYEELRHLGIRRIGHSFDATGGPGTTTHLWTTKRFYEANPHLMTALIAALVEATASLKNNPVEAAKIHLQLDRSNSDPESVAKMIADPDMIWGVVPRNTFKMADFLHKTGRVKNQPASWKDLFFPGVQGLEGS